MSSKHPPLPSVTNQKERKRQRLFAKDIENLLYAMGDRPVSTEATVNALEDVLVEYISQISYSMVNFAKSQNRTRVKLNDLAFTLRNDPMKLARFRYILEQSYKIEKAKKCLMTINMITRTMKMMTTTTMKKTKIIMKMDET